MLEQLQETSKIDADYDAAVVAAKQAAKQAAIDALRKQIDQYALICDHLRAALPQDGIFVRDITMSGSTWGSRLFLYKHQTKISTHLRVQLVWALQQQLVLRLLTLTKSNWFSRRWRLNAWHW